jgi:glycerol kinase
MPGHSAEIVIALDQGSSSSRALAIDPRGRVLARVQIPIRTFYPRAGQIEHDALDIARSLERALDLVLGKIPRSAKILGLGLASQRSTVVLWDRVTGKPAARAPSWQDGRAVSVVAPLQGHQGEAHEITGLYLTPYYSAPKMRWLIEHNPEVRRLLEAGQLMAGPVSSFLVWRLTGGELFAVDPSMAQRMMLFNLRKLDWDETMLALFSLPRSILPRILPSSGEWGLARRGGKSIPILSCLGDQQAAVIGLGGMEPGSSVANYGTGAFLLHNTGSSQHRIPGLLTSMGWKLGDDPPCFLEEGTVHAAGASLDWLRENLGLVKPGADLSRVCRSSRQRIFALQAIGGLGAPRWDYVTQTAFFGLSAQTRASDIVRSVVEGIAFLISDIVQAMRSGGLTLQTLRASGGLSRIDHLMQFQADLLGLEIQRCREKEATAFGVAYLAARAAGVNWAERLAEVRTDRIFRPRMAPQEREGLLSAWERFVAAQVALSREIRLS